MSLARRLVGSAALVTASNGVARITAFAAAPVLTTTFGPEPFGEMALVYSGAALVTIFALAGIDNSYMRYASQGDDREQAAGIERFCWRFAAVSTALLAALTVPLIYGVNLTRFGFDAVAVAATAALAILGVAKIMADTRRRLEGSYSRLAAGMLVGGVITPALSIVFGWYWRPDTASLMVAALIGVLLNVGIVGLPTAGIFLKPSGRQTAHRREIVAFGLPGMVVGTMFWLLGLSDRLILAAYADHTAVGVYAFAASIATAGLVINNAIGISWFPEALRTYEGDQPSAPTKLGSLWARLVMFLLLIWLVVVGIGSDVLQILADQRFHGGSAYIPWLAGGAFFAGVANLANTGLWLGKNMKAAAYAWVTAGIVGVGLNLLLIPQIGGHGAALTSCICNGMVAVVLMTLSQRLYPLDVSWARLAAASVVVTVVGAALYLWHPTRPIVSIAIKLPLIAVTSVVAGWLVAPDWVRWAVRAVVAQSGRGDQ